MPKMYDLGDFDSTIGPYKSDLLELYYRYVHPTLPIIENRHALEAAISIGSIPSSLMAGIYCVAIYFWDASPTLRSKPRVDGQRLRGIVFTSVTSEARTPSLRTIQAILIYLHIPPKVVREPNHPGFWALTCQVSASQVPEHPKRIACLSRLPTTDVDSLWHWLKKWDSTSSHRSGTYP